MKLLASGKLLCALLAAVTVGMGVQTYYLFQVHSQLDARAAGTALPNEADDGRVEDEQSASLPAAPQRLAPADPFARLERAEERMRSLFDGFYERFDAGFGDTGFGNAWFDRAPFFADGDSFFVGDAGGFGPRVDLQDRGDSYELTVDVPGSDETNVVVRAEDGALIVAGSRDSTIEESEGDYMRRERQFGRFERRLSLPRDADVDSLETAFENGVLRVTLQKS